MKRFTVLMALVIIMSQVGYAQTEPTDTDGDGYRNVSSLDHLKWISQNLSSWGLSFELDNDINAADTKNWNGTLGFSPIGNYPTYFTGKFNGHGYKIDSLFINRTAQDFIGLFGYTYVAEIKNIGITNATIKGRSDVGGLVGYNYNSSTISNSYSTGSVSGISNVGGLVGINYPSTISNSYSTGSVTGSSENVGGLVGYNYYSTISNSYSTGSVSGSSSYVGGLVGYNNNYSTISNSYSTGSVAGSSYYVGGLIGFNYYYSTISNSYSTGSVSGSSYYVGGLVGFNKYCQISNSYSTGSVSGSNTYVGGLVGYNITSTISNSYSTGSVTGSSEYVGGLVGFNISSTVSGSFWDTETSGKTTSDGGTGKTTAQMKTKSTFTDALWNFDSTWSISSQVNDGYPYLKIFPTLVSPTNNSTNQELSLTLDWNSVTYATSYDIQLSTVITFATTIVNANTTSTDKAVSGLSYETTYYWRARAISLADTSDWSEVWNFETGNNILNIPLSIGWNLISTYVKPQLPDTMNNVMNEIKSNLLIAKNNGGQVFIPSYNINTIGKWNVTQGYLVYMTAKDTLTITGNAVVPGETPIALTAGWNTIGYLRNSEMSAENAFVSITDNSNLLIAKTLDGKVYIPSYNINTLGSLKPGVGYKVYVTTSDTLLYPGN